MSARCLSSVQKAMWEVSTPSASAPSMIGARFLQAEPSRTSTASPARSFSCASAQEVDSWSVPVPAAMYACRPLPVMPGAWPSTTRPEKSSNLAMTAGSRPATPG